ncbi:MAG: hypothetical protein ACPLSK_04335, partial [bacterium]
MTLRRIVTICITSLLQWGVAYAGVFEKYTAQQDPRVEEAIRIYAKTLTTFGKAMYILWEVWRVDQKIKPPAGPLEEPNFPYLIERLKLIEKEVAGSQPSQAIIDFLIAMSYWCRDNWELEWLIYTGSLDRNARRQTLFKTPTGSFINVPYNPLYAEEALLYQKKALEYNPNMYLSYIWDKDTNEVFYIVNWRDKEEYKEWVSVVKERTGYWEKNPYERFFSSAKPVFSALEGLYLAKQDLASAIYWLEREEMWWMEEFPRLTGSRVMRLYGSEALAGVRMLYLERLKKKGESDKLHPFIYIEGKPIDTAYCLTRKGKPFVAVISFSKALNITAEWTRKGELLTIRKGEDAIKIVLTKGKWLIDDGNGSEPIEAYFKGNELYLPLKELCKVLNL